MDFLQEEEFLIIICEIFKNTFDNHRNLFLKWKHRSYAPLCDFFGSGLITIRNEENLNLTVMLHFYPHFL